MKVSRLTQALHAPLSNHLSTHLFSRFTWKPTPTLAHALARTLALTLALSLSLMISATIGFAQDPTVARTPTFQLEHFEPTGDSAHSIFNLTGADSQAHRQITSGVLCHHAHNPASINPFTGEKEGLFVEITRCELLLSLGLFGEGNISLALPLNLRQRGDQLSVLNLSPEQFDGVTLGDLRISPKIRLFKRNRWGVAASIVTPIHLPTGDGVTLSSAGGVQLGARLALDWVISDWYFVGNIGYRLLNPLQLHNVVLDDSIRWGVALKTPPLLSGLHFTASIYGNQNIANNLDPRNLLQELDDARNDPMESIMGLSWRPVRSDFTLKAGFGLGLNEGIGVAQWRASLGLDWTPQQSSEVSSAQLSKLPRLGVNAQAIIYVPSFTGVIPFVNRRRSAAGSDTLISVNTAATDELYDLGLKLELGQASAFGSDSIGDALYTNLQVTWVVLDDVELGVDIPGVFGAAQPSLGVSRSALSTQTGQLRSPLISSDGASLGERAGLGDLRVQLKTLALNARDRDLGVGLIVPVTLPTATLDAYGRGRARIGSVGVTTWRYRWGEVTQNIGLHIEDNLRERIPLSSVLELGLAVNVRLNHHLNLGAESFMEKIFPKSQQDTSALIGGGVMLGRGSPRISAWAIGARGYRFADVHQVELVFKWRWGAPDVPSALAPDMTQPREQQPREEQPLEQQPREQQPREQQPREQQPREQQPREQQPPVAPARSTLAAPNLDSSPQLPPIVPPLRSTNSILRGHSAEKPRAPYETPYIWSVILKGESTPPLLLRRSADHDEGTTPMSPQADSTPALSASPPKDGRATLAPPPDADQDGIPDARDRCPELREDYDTFEDEDGCPDPDNDGDSVEDSRDRCPLTRGLPMWEGCNDKVIQFLFEVDKAKLRASSAPVLDELAVTIRRYAKLRGVVRGVVIEGHTDDTGTRAHNIKLSEERARVVRVELIKRGVSAKMLSTRGLATTQPLVSTDGLTGQALRDARAKNRRVVLILLFE